MKKICYIIGQLSIGGAERQLYELLRGINRSKFDPIVIALSAGGFWKSEIEKLAIRVIELKRRKHREITRLLNLTSLLKEIKPDIVHTYLFDANSYGRIAAILAGAPVVIASERNAAEIGHDKKKSEIYVDRLLALFSDAIICNSRRAAGTLVKKYSLDSRKVITVHNGIDADLSGKAYGDGFARIAGKVIGIVGTLCPQKNHRLFLDMAKIVLEKLHSEDLKFLIVGTGSLEHELKNYCGQLGIEEKVLFVGEKNDIPNLLQNIDIFVLPSKYEGLSNAIMEAMAAGLPVVATDVGGNKELILDRISGFLCPPENVQALAQKVIDLLGSPSEAKRMGENGRRRVLSKFTVEKMVVKTERIYERLLKNKMLLPERSRCSANSHRVLFVIPGASKGASMIFAKRQAASLQNLGAAVNLFFLGSRTSLPAVLKEGQRLRREIKTFKPDLIHAQYGSVTAFLCMLATSRPLVVTYRGGDLNPTPSVPWLRCFIARCLSQLAALRAKRIICVAAQLKEKLWWRRGRASVIPSGVDTRLFYPRPQAQVRKEIGWRKSEPVVLFNAGRNNKAKRLDLAKSAVEVARSMLGEFRFEVLNGTVEPTLIPDLMNASDCLLMTSDWEGSPNVVKEALACNLPIVSVDVGDTRERINGVKLSWIVERDPIEIGKALAQILAGRRRSNGFKAVERISMDRCSQQILSIYQQVLTDRK